MTEPTQSHANPSVSRIHGLDTERRIAWLTPLLGLTGALMALFWRRPDWAEGLLLGAILAWLNFRWLRRGMDALVGGSAAQEGLPKPRVPLISYFTAAFRYALLALGVYVIFVYLHVPLVSLIVGLCALGAAAVAASVWEILHPAE
ncbi:MAG TPA: ATP synthase subunit I [Candidatus Acidoferrum sp.]|nr:ATP synthase subunit I [Candidatus Acidoferrum sp.]